MCVSVCVCICAHFVSVSRQQPDAWSAWACETEGGQPDWWLRETEAGGRFVKHNTGRRNGERGRDGGGGEGMRVSERTQGEKGARACRSVQPEVVILMFLGTVKRQTIGWLWRIDWPGLSLTLDVAPGERLNFDLAQYFNKQRGAYEY